MTLRALHQVSMPPCSRIGTSVDPDDSRDGLCLLSPIFDEVLLSRLLGYSVQPGGRSYTLHHAARSAEYLCGLVYTQITHHHDS